MLLIIFTGTGCSSEYAVVTSKVSYAMLTLGLVLFTLLMGLLLFYQIRRCQHLQKEKTYRMYESHILRTLIDNVPDFIYVKDLRSRFIIANKFLADIHGVSDPGHIIGKTDFDLYPKDLAQKFYDDEQEIIRTKIPRVNFEEAGLDKKRNPIILSTTKVPWLNEKGKILGIIGIGRDITKFKEIEHKLLEQTKDLQEFNILLEEKHEHINQQAEELTEQAESLKRLNEELHKMNDTKDKFISIIAHDLKNPFNAIINFSELLILKTDHTIKPKQLEMIKIINSSSKMAYSLLENLLYWGKSQSSTIPFRPDLLAINDIIKEVIDFHEVSARLKNIVIINNAVSEFNVFADHDMVTTILRNLMSNAIKFTPKNGEIRITSSLDNQYGYITVADSGLGISNAELSKLFQPAKDITKGTSGETGTGLGLVLCKEFALKNGGDILVKSEIRKGSSFILSLPLPAVI